MRGQGIVVALPVLLACTTSNAFVHSSARSSLTHRQHVAKVQRQQCRHRHERHLTGGKCSAAMVMEAVASEGLAAFPYDSVLPFLKEHVQPSDQLLILGARNTLPLLLSADGYGTRDTRSFVLVVDSDAAALEAAQKAAALNPATAANLAAGQLRFELKEDLTAMDDLEQSCVDAVLDNGMLDWLLSTGREAAAGGMIDAVHRAVRLGNPLICLSSGTDKDTFCSPFESRFGWVQELDGDPGAVSMWHRDQKINMKGVANDFAALGLKMYVYTNVDNC
eukprot:TRINITY_DN3330_c0_g1_i1.p1 TRINITY_DN3330_c0_g1~~TRINITY_DN3330_c0_g1_i1.p1  ORF type:complete len:297 (+),score=81.73 TRINITY_DN3330_c0_g1_i1:59-892(+)